MLKTIELCYILQNNLRLTVLLDIDYTSVQTGTLKHLLEFVYHSHMTVNITCEFMY